MTSVADKVFEHYTTQKTNGFFIESGCNNGVDGSATLRLERERNWRGILLDASPQAMEQCKKNRSSRNIFVNAALTSPENEGKVLLGSWDGDPRGSVDGKAWPTMHPVPANIPAVGVTLESILKKSMIEEVDLWVLDLEGHEMEALKGIGKYRPRLVVIEIHGVDKFNPLAQRIEEAGEIVMFMRDHGYYCMENVSNFSKETDPTWSGTHGDYLFERCGDVWG